MIPDGTDWKGYQNVTTDARGFNPANTSPNGPIQVLVHQLSNQTKLH